MEQMFATAASEGTSGTGDTSNICSLIAAPSEGKTEVVICI